MPMTVAEYLGQTPEDAGTAPASDFGQQLIDAAKVIAAYQTSQKCLDLNIARAQQGLPPVDCSEAGMGIQLGISSQAQQTILIVVGVLAAAYLLPKMFR